MEDQQLIQLALSQKYLTHAQLKLAKDEQKTLADRGLERSLWFLVQDLGFITEEQARDLRTRASSAHNRALEVEGYVIQGRIGSGGMGDVFRGRRADGHEVAIKLLSSKFSNDNEYALRFKREAAATLRLNHPHITRSLSDGEVDGHRYLIMELVDGSSLRGSLSGRGKLPETEALHLLAQMADALGYAWTNGILHRDVKPANIILGAPRPGVAEPFCAKLCDFGLAKVWQTSRYTIADLTKSGVALGTPHYMSPEQAAGEHDLDQRSDIYSLGSTVYHAVLGQTMYNGKSSAVIMYKHVNEALDLQPLRDAGLSEELVRLIGGMLAKDRAARFPDWNAVLSETRSLLRARTSRSQASAPRPAAPAAAVASAPRPAARTTEIAPASAARAAPVAVKSAPVAAASAVAVATPPPIPSPSAAARPPPAPVRPAPAPPAAPDSRSGSSLSRGSRLRRLRGQLVLRLIGISLLVAALVAGVFFGVVSRGGGSTLRADPASFAQVLKDAVGGHAAVIVLQPGEYRGPWQLGVAQAHLRLRAGGPGVRLLGTGAEPLVQLKSGLADAALEGVTLVPRGGVAIEALGVASARLEHLVVEGPCATVLTANGSRLEIRDLVARATVHGIELDGGALTIDDSFAASPAPALRARNATLVVRRCRFAAIAAGPALFDLAGGRATFEAVIGDAAGCERGLRASQDLVLELADVALAGGRVGVSTEGARLQRIDGLSIDALDIGLAWAGSRDPAWTWSGIAVHAAQGAVGLEGVALAAAGARPESLARVPAAPSP